MESPLRGNTHGGFGERPGETDREQSRHRAPGRLNQAEHEAVDEDGIDAEGDSSGDPVLER